MRSDKIKKEMRRVAVFSLCCVVLCMACLVSATFAYFKVSVTNEGNVISVAEFEATGEIFSAENTTLDLNGEEVPVVITDGICEKGEYALNIDWNGSADGYLAVHITSLELNSETEDLMYIISLPALEEGEESQNVVVPLTLHEAAYVSTESSWGTPEGAVTLEELAQDERAITFGKQFDVCSFVDGEPVSEIGGVFTIGQYELSLYWESEVDGYYVIEVEPKDRDSETDADQYIIKLPRTDVMDEGYGELFIPLTFHEETRVTAVVRKGAVEGAIDPADMTDIEFGEPVVDWAVIGPETSDGEYPAGEYTLEVEWQGVFNYIMITLTGEDDEETVYYLSCEGTDGETSVPLILNTAAKAVTVDYGWRVTEDMTESDADGIVYGTADESTEDEGSAGGGEPGDTSGSEEGSDSATGDDSGSEEGSDSATGGDSGSDESSGAETGDNSGSNEEPEGDAESVAES